MFKKIKTLLTISVISIGVLLLGCSGSVSANQESDFKQVSYYEFRNGKYVKKLIDKKHNKIIYVSPDGICVTDINGEENK